jgi:hypothetical protein
MWPCGAAGMSISREISQNPLLWSERARLQGWNLRLRLNRKLLNNK